MKRITYWALSTVSALVLLFGYHTSTSSQMPASTEAPYVASGSSGTSRTSSAASSGSGGTGATTRGSSAGTRTSSASSSRSSSASSKASSSPKASTVTGDTIQTRWGPVQVQLGVTGSRITSVTVLRYPDGNSRDAEINAQALPILVQETQRAQSAKIDMVSGATYTSDGYIQSLQSALDKVDA